MTSEATRITVTITLDEDEAKAIACVRRQDVAFDECEPADPQEIQEHLEGYVELACEEANPDW